MSSDGDEDELLQRALKEQSQRDTSYRKPNSGRKPVVNFVQPPKPTSTSHKHSRSSLKKDDDDDDSDVEMLSISSGDEDVGGEKTITRPRGRREDDAWDGQEPNCWKRVDEGEVRFFYSASYSSVGFHLNSKCFLNSTFVVAFSSGS